MNKFLFNLLLALAWVAVMGSFTLGTFLAGLLIGYVILLLTEPLLNHTARPKSSYARRVPQVVTFAGYFLWELLLSNLRVARDVLSPRPRIRPGVVAIPLDAKSPGEITLLANLITMTPGTLSLEVSDDRKVLYIHAMYLDDLEELRRSTKEGFETRVLEVMR